MIDQTTREQMVTQNIGLVHACANRFRGRGAEYDDLFSAGSMGLVKAVDGFDYTRGVKFSTYAVPVILGEIRRLFRDGGLVKVSRGLKELSLKAGRERERFMAAHAREPSMSELAGIMALSDEQTALVVGAGLQPISLTITDEDGEEFDLPASDTEERLSDHISLNQVLESLPPRDRELIVRRYFQGKTQAETAGLLGMTQVQVSRREKKLLLEMREKLT